MTDEQRSDLSKVILLVLIFLVGFTDIRLLYMYLIVAWLGNDIKEEMEGGTTV